MRLAARLVLGNSIRRHGGGAAGPARTHLGALCCRTLFRRMDQVRRFAPLATPHPGQSGAAAPTLGAAGAPSERPAGCHCVARSCINRNSRKALGPTPIPHLRLGREKPRPISTPLQRGAPGPGTGHKRSSGLSISRETGETVRDHAAARNTMLKHGVRRLGLRDPSQAF